MWQGLYFSWTHWTCFMTWEFSFNSLASKKKTHFLSYQCLHMKKFSILTSLQNTAVCSSKPKTAQEFPKRKPTSWVSATHFSINSAQHLTCCELLSMFKKKDKNKPWHISTASFLKLSNLLNHLTCFPSRNLTYAALPNGFLLGWAVTAASLDG